MDSKHLQVSVVFRHTQTTPAIRDYAESKLLKIERYVWNPTKAHIVLSVEKFRHTAAITVTADNTLVKSNETREDMYTAIDGAVDKIEKQLKKYQGKIKGRKHHGGPREAGGR